MTAKIGGKRDANHGADATLPHLTAVNDEPYLSLLLPPSSPTQLGAFMHNLWEELHNCR